MSRFLQDGKKIQVIRLRGQGNVVPHGSYGDILVVIHEKPMSF
jgi:DnaJ-class molecular chaperone